MLKKKRGQIVHRSVIEKKELKMKNKKYLKFYT